MLDHITPLIITYNEAPNIRRTLNKLLWAKRIVVIDSGSNDGTLDILKEHDQVDVLSRPFTDFADQCNFGLKQVNTAWALSLDADYELSDELVEEIRQLSESDAVCGFRARFIYRIHGRPLRGALYPARAVLYRKDRASYKNEGHGHRVEINGRIDRLRGAIYHDDRKPLARWFASQQRYTRDEADHLQKLSRDEMRFPDRLRFMGFPAPFLVFFYTLFVKGCVFDGWAGWHYALQRLCAEVMLALELVDRRLERKSELN
jgi:glycosyltransferase involved in cell wall biosynthesis